MENIKSKIDGEGMKLENRCGNYNTSRTFLSYGDSTPELKAEIKKFSEYGCYNCDGQNEECSEYYNPFAIYSSTRFRSKAA